MLLALHYLCFRIRVPVQAAPDPLWTLLASRIRHILSLAVELGALSKRVRSRGGGPDAADAARAQADWVRDSRTCHGLETPS